MDAIIMQQSAGPFTVNIGATLRTSFQNRIERFASRDGVSIGVKEVERFLSSDFTITLDGKVEAMDIVRGYIADIIAVENR